MYGGYFTQSDQPGKKFGFLMDWMDYCECPNF